MSVPLVQKQKLRLVNRTNARLSHRPRRDRYGQHHPDGKCEPSWFWCHVPPPGASDRCQRTLEGNREKVPPRCGCWVAHMAFFRRGDWFLGKAHTLARALSRCSACNHLEIAAGDGHGWLWSVVAEAVVRACLTSARYKGAWGRRGSVPRRVSRSATAFISAIRAKFGLGIIWLSEVRVGDLFRVATPLVPGERPGAVFC